MTKRKKAVGHATHSLSKTERPSTVENKITKDTSKDQAPPVEFLIGSVVSDEIFDRTCESARTICGFSQTLDRWCVIQVRCKRWGCRHCGARKATHFGWKCFDARPNRLVTLTVHNDLWSTPRESYDRTKRKVAELAVKLRRRYKEFEYFRVLEVTRKGWPHYHLIVRSPYIPQSHLSKMWNQLTGARIVDVRKIQKTRHVYQYVMKYLSKQKYIPWTNRRLTWSKNFFDKPEFDKPEGLKLIDVGWFDEHPKVILETYWDKVLLTAFSSDCWTLPEGIGEQLGKPMRLHRKQD